MKPPYSSLANPRTLRNVLDRFNIAAKHGLGQNFLIDDNIIGKILELAQMNYAEISSVDKQKNTPILEIGPGIGTLSVALLKFSPVIAVEKDTTLLPVLQHTTSGSVHSIHVINLDALKLEEKILASVISESNLESLPNMLIANLPYQIAATLILDYFERFPFLDTMVVMVQREVANRICAQCGNKDYGAYSLKLSTLAQVAGRFEVSHACFYPQPRVESAVIRLDRIKSEDMSLSIQQRARVCRVIDAAFAQRRKTIRNSLMSEFSKEEVETMLACAHIDPKMRAEQLGLDSFICMALHNMA